MTTHSTPETPRDTYLAMVKNYVDSFESTYCGRETLTDEVAVKQHHAFVATHRDMIRYLTQVDAGFAQGHPMFVNIAAAYIAYRTNCKTLGLPVKPMTWPKQKFYVEGEED